MAKDITAKAIITGRIDASASLGQTVIQYIGEANPYTGDYTVDPDFDGQVLQTRQKYMRDNVTITPIQVESVSNPTGGRTVYIGGII